VTASCCNATSESCCCVVFVVVFGCWGLLLSSSSQSAVQQNNKCGSNTSRLALCVDRVEERELDSLYIFSSSTSYSSPPLAALCSLSVAFRFSLVWLVYCGRLAGGVGQAGDTMEPRVDFPPLSVGFKCVCTKKRK